MSQKANTYLILPEPSEEFIASEPRSIETYADGLMDELFTDINLILDGRDSLLSQTVLPQEDIRQVQTVTVPQIVVPETQIRPIQKVPTSVPKARNNPLSQVGVGTPRVRISIKKSSRKSKPTKGKRTKGIVLWMGVTIGLATASILWVLNSGLLNRLVSKSLQQSLLQPQVQPQVPIKAQVEADLVNYMLGALAVIDKQEARSHLQSVSAHQSALAYITPQSTDHLSASLAAKNLSSASSNSTTVVKPYIPVYQAPQPMHYAPPTKQPTATAPTPAAPSLLPEEQKVVSTVTTPHVAASYTLERLLELGNKSAALFKMNGVTRRVEVGDAIGSSDWTLMEVVNDKAIIRRNGEVRSIYTGQTF
ncbi:MAG: hypothetical protein KME30_19165 [Iphinoe sp. HA4291-MV1]|nr:hypothetical protein [Iphinoe sp. HA4291-MV1]